MAASKLIKDPLDDELGPRCVMCGGPADNDSSGHPYGLRLICRIEDEKRFQALKAEPVPAIKSVELELSGRPGWPYHYDGRHPSGHAPSCNCEWCMKGGVMKCCYIAQKEPGREFGIACDDFWLLWTLCDYHDKQHGSHEEKIEKLKKKFPSI